MTPSTSPQWTPQEIKFLEENYGITSIIELAKLLQKEPEDIRAMIEQKGLRESFLAVDSEDRRLKLMILLLLQENKRYLPNGWLLGLAMGQRILNSLVHQLKTGDTWLEEVEDEINSVLDAISQLYAFTPLLSVGDRLLGADHGQVYRITGREFVPADQWITYYYTYLYGGGDSPEEYDEEDWPEEDEVEGLTKLRLHDN
ncbi:hypothetical protein GO755_04955 [Spirosoma sp. HMF4905]|uniref:Uncharacterized protein n=1 Tax=Spirosoma arboris TaxID=2682092 RepID=A0A7K1S6D1_9BACT|nr:hypothetical protein [Spirosoma arboris]MVM29373.1 hypothetical protein [Spirosoma arboris]